MGKIRGQGGAELWIYLYYAAGILLLVSLSDFAAQRLGSALIPIQVVLFIVLAITLYLHKRSNGQNAWQSKGSNRLALLLLGAAAVLTWVQMAFK